MHATQAGLILGTAAYISPDRAAARQSGVRTAVVLTNAKRLTAEIDLGADRRLTGLRLAFGVFIDSYKRRLSVNCAGEGREWIVC
jgi:hypothetical protein